jgi:hypothetical protein
MNTIISIVAEEAQVQAPVDIALDVLALVGGGEATPTFY